MDKEKEYWEIDLDNDLKNDLDSELLEELNNLDDDSKEELEKGKNKKGKKVIALITLTIFSFFILNSIFRFSSVPDLGFLGESFKLKQEEEIQNLQEAVVSIQNQQKLGTGFNISPDGIIVTNEHVIRDGENIFIQFPSGKSFKGSPELIIPELDFAILSVEGEDLPYLKTGTSSDIVSGQEVLIIGNPLGFSGIVKKGEVIGTGKVNTIEEEVIFIKGPIHKGSSGSPVFNSKEEVIAIIFATLIQESSNTDEIIGVAIPIDLVTTR